MAKDAKNLTDQTTRRLREMVISSGLKPGEVFGREAELGQKLGVSRSILREAINRLRALGLLESRQCVGLVVGKPDPVALFEQAFEAGLMDSLDMADLAELRYTLEIGAVELVVRRATPEPPLIDPAQRATDQQGRRKGEQAEIQVQFVEQKSRRHGDQTEPLRQQDFGALGFIGPQLAGNEYTQGG